MTFDKRTYIGKSVECFDMGKICVVVQVYEHGLTVQSSIGKEYFLYWGDENKEWKLAYPLAT